MGRVVIAMFVLALVLPSINALDIQGKECGTSEYSSCSNTNSCSYQITNPQPCGFNCEETIQENCDVGLECIETSDVGYDETVIPLGFTYCIDEQNGCIPYSEDYPCGQNKICNPETYLCEDKSYVTDPEETYICSVTDFGVELDQEVICSNQNTCSGKYDYQTYQNTCLDGRECHVSNGIAYCLGVSACTDNTDCSTGFGCNNETFQCEDLSEYDLNICTAHWQCLEDQVCDSGTCKDGVINEDDSYFAYSLDNLYAGSYPNNKGFRYNSNNRGSNPLYYRSSALHSGGGLTGFSNINPDGILVNGRNTNCDDDDSNQGTYGVCRDSVSVSYWGKVAEYSDPFQLRKLRKRKIDDYAHLHIFDQYGRSTFANRDGSIETHAYETNYNSLYTQEIDLAPGWYHFVITWWDSGGNDAEFGIEHAKDLDEMFATENGKVMVDSGNFLDPFNNPVAVRANFTNTLTFGNELIGMNFWLEKTIWHTIRLPEGNWKNLVASCSRWPVQIDKRHLGDGIIYLRSDHGHSQPALCGLLAWSEEFENSDSQELEVRTENMTTITPRLNPNNVWNDCGTYSISTGELTLEGTAENCGIVISQKQEIDVGDDISIIDGGVITVREFTVDKGSTSGYDMLFGSEMITQTFGFPIKGALVKCEGNSNSKLKNKYSYRNNDLLFFPSDTTQECVAIAWSNVCSSDTCGEGTQCYLDEGTVVTNEFGEELSCLWDEQNSETRWFKAASVISEQLIIPHDSQIIGNQGRNDMTSDGNKFLQCGTHLFDGDIFTVPKKLRGGNIGSGTDTEEFNSDGIVIYDITATCDWNAGQNDPNLVGQDCSNVPEENLCLGAEFVLDPSNPDNICCIGVPGTGNEGNVCVPVQDCSDLGGAVLGVGQGCLAEVTQLNGGALCCMDPNGIIELPQTTEDEALICTQTLGDGILYNCLSDVVSRPTPYELYPGMATTKVSNETGELEDANGYLKVNFTANESNLPYLVNGDLTVDEGFIYYPENMIIRTDWSSATQLNLDMLTTLKNLTYLYIITADGIKHPMIDANEFFKANNLAAVSIPLTNKDLNGNSVDYTKIKHIALGHYESGGIFNLWAVMKNLVLTESNTMYCGGKDYGIGAIKGFIPDYDNFTNETDKIFAQHACDATNTPSSYLGLNPRVWTGNSCCGDDINLQQEINEEIMTENILQNSEFRGNNYWSETDFFNYLNFVSGELRISGGLISLPAYLRQTISVDVESSIATINYKVKGTNNNVEFRVKEYDEDNNLIVETTINPVITSNYDTDFKPVNLDTNTKRIQFEIKKNFGTTDVTFEYVELIVNHKKTTILGISASKEKYSDYDGCFEGIRLFSGSRVGLALNNQSQNDLAFIRDQGASTGRFIQCDFYNNSANKYADYYQTDNKGRQTTTRLVEESYGLCEPINGLVCTGAGFYDEQRPVSFNLTQSVQGFNVGEYVYCENGQLLPAVEKKDWYLNETGYCHQDMCYCPSYLSECTGTTIAQSCAYNNTYYDNHLCLSGQWTTRTAFAGAQILANTGLGDGSGGEDGTLHCGPVELTLNNYTVSYLTDACVYHTFDLTPKVIVAMPIPENKLNDFVNKEIKDQFLVVEGNGFNTTLASTMLANGAATVAPGIGQYDYNISIYYDRDLSIIYISNDNFMNTNFWEDLLNGIDNFFGGGVEKSTDYDNLYIFEDDDQLVYGFGNNRYNPITQELQNDYEIIYDLSSNDLNEIELFLENRANIVPVRNNDVLNVTLRDDVKTWTSLTSATRINPR